MIPSDGNNAQNNMQLEKRNLMGTLSNYHLFPKKKVKHPPCCIITSKLKKWKWKSFLLMGTMLKLVRWERLPKKICNPSLEKVKIKGWEYFRWKKRFCSVYGSIWPHIWPWILSVHELVMSEKARSVVLYTSKNTFYCILFETQREFILNEDASYWLVASVRCNQFEKCASCISIELRFANAHPLV